jgi:hypothetical protein
VGGCTKIQAVAAARPRNKVSNGTHQYLHKQTENSRVRDGEAVAGLCFGKPADLP